MARLFSPTPEETSLADRIISSCSGGKTWKDHLDSDSAVKVFSSSGLSPVILADVWNETDEGLKGYLTRDEVAIALRLIGWAQTGVKITGELVTKNGPLAYIKGFDPESPRNSPLLPDASTVSSSHNVAPAYPPLSLDRRSTYKSIFRKAGAGKNKNTLDKEQVWKLWQKSGLPEATLSSIWNLVNTQNHDCLTSEEFCLGMYFIQGLLEKRFAVIPDTIPQHLTQTLLPSNVAPIPSPLKSSVDASIPRPSKPPKDAPIPSPLKSPDIASIPSLLNSPFSSAALPTTSQVDSWEVPQPFIDYTMRLFVKLDSSQRGYLDEVTAVSLLKKSKLSNNDLALIWNLADISGTGRLSRDEFVIALFLVSRKLSGFDIPTSLPLSFITTFSFPDVDSPSDPVLSPTTPTLWNNSSSHDVSGGLYAQIRALQDTIEAMGRENDDLRSSMETMSRISRQQSLHNNRMSRHMDTSVAEIARLEAQLRAKDVAVTRLQASLKVTEDLSRENTVFRLQVQELASQLEIANGDLAVQTLLAEENSRAADHLRRQVEELRESSTQVPSVSGDEELQTLINEDLSRENRRLQGQVHDLQESLAQLQAATEELDVQKDTTRTLTRENKRLQRRVRELESENVETQTELRRRVEELSQQNERLRRELQSSRMRHGRQTSTDVPPPAYEEIQ